MKEGVPIGDCVETASAGLAGCPPEPPTLSESCEAPGGVYLQCPYEIRVERGRAAQVIYTCHPEQLFWGGFMASCGEVCRPPDANVLELDASDCEQRAITSCKDLGAAFGFETQQQWFDSAFEKLIASCFGEVLGRQFQLEVENGCPARLSSSAPFSSSAQACLTDQLNQLRWDCALDLSCSTFLRALTSQ